MKAIPIWFIKEKKEELEEEIEYEDDAEYIKGLQQKIYALDDLIHFWQIYQIIKKGIEFYE